MFSIHDSEFEVSLPQRSYLKHCLLPHAHWFCCHWASWLLLQHAVLLCHKFCGIRTDVGFGMQEHPQQEIVTSFYCCLVRISACLSLSSPFITLVICPSIDFWPQGPAGESVVVQQCYSKMLLQHSKRISTGKSPLVCISLCVVPLPIRKSQSWLNWR